jgi:hypothetical protein
VDDEVKGERPTGPRASFDASLLLKRNGRYERADVAFDRRRGNVWLRLQSRDVLCVEAPRLRRLMGAHDGALAESGLPPVTEDGDGR